MGSRDNQNLRTVEGELLRALEEAGLIKNLSQSNYSIAGRTDRGVHALGNVVSFCTDKMPIINQLNDLLPQDMRILGSAQVPIGFKTRFAHRRHYRYVMYNTPRERFEIGQMKEAACLMEGTHNFLNFSKRNERNPIRKVESVIIKPQNQTLIVDVVGESFLWNMVRKMVAVLSKVGKGELEVEEVEKFFDPEYKAAINPMPPESLFLKDVFYKNVQFKEDGYAKIRFLQALNKELLDHQRMVAATQELILALNED